MMKHTQTWLFCLAIFLSIPLSVPGQTTIKHSDTKEIEKWISSTFSPKKLPPFSFVYDGKPSSSFLKKWKFQKQKEADSSTEKVKYQFTYTNPDDGMQVICHVTGYRDFQAVEWVLHFSNTSGHRSANIRDINVADCLFSGGKASGYTLRTAAGSTGSRGDFRPLEYPMETDSTYRFSPERGRSSDGMAFPFYNLIPTNTENGCCLAIGWTGTWFANFTPQENGISIFSGLKNADFFLYPGESVRTPLVSFLFWTGDDMTGHNRFRQFILAHHTRKINGKMADPPLCGGFDWGDPAPCNEYGCLTEDMAIALAKRYQQFGILPEVFWLDAGWYTGSGGPNFEGRNWANTVGSWTIDEERFPHGFKTLSNVIHSLGAKFMVWFEPERVMEGTKFAVEHPEWMLKVPGNNSTFLYDLGNRQACDYLCQYIGDFIQENGIDYYRQDFNMPIDDYWAANDEPGRKGIKEIRHIEGLYRFWDYLLERFPELQIDNCSSGGRRIDLETTSRSLPLWRTDYHYGEPNGYQCHTYGLNMFLPLHGTGIYGTDPYNSRSSFSSAMVINWELAGRSGSIGDMQQVLATYKEIRPYYLKDYYPLTGLGDLTGDDVWLAYQLHDADNDSGIVVAFKRFDARQNQIEVSLQRIDPEAQYEIFDDNTGKRYQLSGQELANGWKLSIEEASGSLLYKYQKLTP